MSDLTRVLDGYVPPPVPEGLSARVAAAVTKFPQEPARLAWRRRSRPWRRGALIGGAALGLALATAVAAEVASGGRIELPVVHQVVAAIPALRPASQGPQKAKQLASRSVRPTPKPAPAVTTPLARGPETRHEQALARFVLMKQKVDERREAGLPTPNADRIERKAKRIAERREAAGLPVPSVDEIELRLAVREWRTMRMLRQVARDPSAISGLQVERFARILPPQKRAQFLALGGDRQRELMGRAAQRFLARRMHRQAANSQPAEGPGEPPR